ncbi:hypothetical protein, partial [Klebsiella pneumoniae]|uniref:hypothetical protein n=1 Tax=Klebsiella pneumoniae TaxID=573 RepID=UPI00405536B8
DQFHKKFEVPTITEAIRRRHIKFFDSIQHCQNPLFSELRPPPLPERWQRSRSAGADRQVDILATSVSARP